MFSLAIKIFQVNIFKIKIFKVDRHWPTFFSKPFHFLKREKTFGQRLKTCQKRHQLRKKFEKFWRKFLCFFNIRQKNSNNYGS
jgi:hypothetical protein